MPRQWLYLATLGLLFTLASCDLGTRRAVDFAARNDGGATNAQTDPVDASVGDGEAGDAGPRNETELASREAGGLVTPVEPAPSAREADAGLTQASMVDAGPGPVRTDPAPHAKADAGSRDTPTSPPPLGPNERSDGGEMLEDVRPYIAQVKPANHSTGVRTAEALLITFNEPMDRESVERALAAPWLPPPATYTWLDDDTLLLVPMVLEYQTELVTYYYEIDGSAKSANGEPLGKTFVGEFTLAKTLLTTSPVSNNRNWTPGDVGEYSFLLAGDTSDNRVTKGFCGYYLRVPQGNVLGVNSAILRTNVRDIHSGNPFEALGDLYLHQARYVFTGTPTLEMYDAEPLESFLLLAADSPAFAVGQEVKLDLTSAFQRAYQEGWQEAQFILAFSDPSTDLDGTADAFHLGNSANPELAYYNRVDVQWLCEDDCY